MTRGVPLVALLLLASFGCQQDQRTALLLTVSAKWPVTTFSLEVRDLDE